MTLSDLQWPPNIYAVGELLNGILPPMPQIIAFLVCLRCTKMRVAPVPTEGARSCRILFSGADSRQWVTSLFGLVFCWVRILDWAKRLSERLIQKVKSPNER